MFLIDPNNLIAQVADSGSLSASFSITVRSTIPSDGAEHKVTVGVIQLNPRLVHETVPSK